MSTDLAGKGGPYRSFYRGLGDFIQAHLSLLDVVGEIVRVYGYPDHGILVEPVGDPSPAPVEDVWGRA